MEDSGSCFYCLIFRPSHLFEDSGKTLEIELVKAEEHSLWKSIIDGKGLKKVKSFFLRLLNFDEDIIDPFVEEDFKKKMMLERFQGEEMFHSFIASVLIFQQNRRTRRI